MNDVTPQKRRDKENTITLPEKITETDIKKFQLIQSVRSFSENNGAFPFEKMTEKQTSTMLKQVGKLIDNKHETEMTSHKESMKDKDNTLFIIIGFLVFALIVICIVAFVKPDLLDNVIALLVGGLGGGGLGYGYGAKKSNSD